MEVRIAVQDTSKFLFEDTINSEYDQVLSVNKLEPSIKLFYFLVRIYMYTFPSSMVVKKHHHGSTESTPKKNVSSERMKTIF